MRILILFLLCFAAAGADVVSKVDPYAPPVFDSESAMNQWAASLFGGAARTELTYRKRKLVVFFRSYTSGVSTSEPVVFVQDENRRWIQVLRAMICPFEMEATIEKDALVLWRLEWPKGKRNKTEFMRFNLSNLDVVKTPKS